MVAIARRNVYHDHDMMSPALRNLGSISKLVPKGQNLPEAFRWEEDHRSTLGHDDYDPEEQIPLIDLSVLAKEDNVKKLAKEIAQACEEWGAFQVLNHGVSEEILEKARIEAQKVFALSEEEKFQARRAPGTLFGYGTTRMAPFFNRLMWSEAFTMMGSPLSNISDYATKLWKIDSSSRDEFSKSFEEYNTAMRELALMLSRLIFVGLGADEDEVDELSRYWGLIHMNYYPPCPNPSQTIGLASHTDSSSLTIMHQGNVGGLQVKRNDKWVAVKPHPNAFVVQVGDMLQVMSNDRYKSVTHRAVVNDKQTRLSLVYFFSPAASTSISPVDHQKPVYRCLTWDDYLQAKAKHFMGALDHFMLSPRGSNSP